MKIMQKNNYFKWRKIKLLQQYKDDIDNFYLEERKGIYIKFAFQAGGDIQEKF